MLCFCSSSKANVDGFKLWRGNLLINAVSEVLYSAEMETGLTVFEAQQCNTQDVLSQKRKNL